MPHAGRGPVPEEGLPEDLPAGERRPARMRLVAARRLAGLTVALDGVHDPHNVSAALRSAEGFGLMAAHLIAPRVPPGPPPDPARRKRGGVNPAVTRGCEKWLQVHRYASPGACVRALRAAGFELWAAAPDRSAPRLEEVDFSRRVALVFGAERDGLSAELLAACDGRYQIPMCGFSQSLNVSVAAAISLYTASTARRRALGRDTDLSDEEIRALADGWIQTDRPWTANEE